jgi:hypothetical protein
MATKTVSPTDPGDRLRLAIQASGEISDLARVAQSLIGTSASEDDTAARVLCARIEELGSAVACVLDSQAPFAQFYETITRERMPAADVRHG